MPVSLARGIIRTGPFELNAHGFYSILIRQDGDATPLCNIGLETRRISSIGGLPVYRYQWLEDQSRSMGRNTIAGSFLGGFEGKPGNYDLDIEVVSDTGCLDVRKPRLYIIASNNDFAKLNNLYEDALWLLLFLGAIGLAVLIIGIRESFRRRPIANCSLELFEPTWTGNHSARQRVKAAPWIPFFSQVGLLYSQILLLGGICGVLVFHHAWGAHRSQGLFVAVGLSPKMKDHTCDEALVVRIDAKKNWYLNSARISQSELARLLNQQLGSRSNCAAYFDGDPSLPYAVAIQAIDTIQESRAMVVVLSTPKTRDSHLLRPRRHPQN